MWKKQHGKRVENIQKNVKKIEQKKWGKNEEKKVWEKCEKPKRVMNVKNSGGKNLEKNVETIGVEKKWINDLER